MLKDLLAALKPSRHLWIDCPRSGPGQVQGNFSGPGPGPLGLVHSPSGPGPGPSIFFGHEYYILQYNYYIKNTKKKGVPRAQTTCRVSFGPRFALLVDRT